MSRKRTVIKNQLLWKRISDNYPSLLEFHETSGVPLGWEVIRRAVYEGEEISAPALIILMKYIGFTASEIKKHLKNKGEKEFSAMIGKCDVPLVQYHEWEKALLETVGKIRKKNPAAMTQITNIIETIAKAEGIETGKLSRRRK